jgi:hypothetical protein
MRSIWWLLILSVGCRLSVDKDSDDETDLVVTESDDGRDTDPTSDTEFGETDIPVDDTDAPLDSDVFNDTDQRGDSATTDTSSGNWLDDLLPSDTDTDAPNGGLPPWLSDSGGLPSLPGDTALQGLWPSDTDTGGFNLPDWLDDSGGLSNIDTSLIPDGWLGDSGGGLPPWLNPGDSDSDAVVIPVDSDSDGTNIDTEVAGDSDSATPAPADSNAP